MVPLFVAALLLAPLLIVAMIAGAASPFAVFPAIALVLALLFASASWEWWRGTMPPAWRLVPIVVALLSVWMLSIPLASSSTTWLVLLTTVVAVTAIGAEVLERRRDERSRRLPR